MRNNPITAHHGTANKFSKFDPKRVVGTGSRGQFGWGIYLTDSDEVAASYGREAETGKAFVLRVCVAAEEDEFIDWLASWTGQPRPVQEALRRLAAKRDAPGRLLADLFNDQDNGETSEEGWAGRQFYSILLDAFPEGSNSERARKVSQWLAKGGIAGTKFPDKTTGMDGSATNYCVFDLKRLRIEGVS